MTNKSKSIRDLFILIGPIILLIILHYTHFDWKTLRYHFDRSYINQALPELKEFIGDDWYPETDEDKDMVNFKVEIYSESYYEREGGSFLSGNFRSWLPKYRDDTEVRTKINYSRGKFVLFYITSPEDCELHKIEFFVADDFSYTKRTYHSARYSDDKFIDRDCKFLEVRKSL